MSASLRSSPFRALTSQCSMVMGGVKVWYGWGGTRVVFGGLGACIIGLLVGLLDV